MSTAAATERTTPSQLQSISRILDEGYGPGAWHGADLKAAIADVDDKLAVWRPGKSRHNIAEIALHHAFCVNNVVAQLTGAAAEPFPIEGSDWFTLPDTAMSWSRVKATVEAKQQALSNVAAGLRTGRLRPAVTDEEVFNLALGVTCHAVYHAGQIQLIKVLSGTA